MLNKDQIKHVIDSDDEDLNAYREDIRSLIVKLDQGNLEINRLVQRVGIQRQLSLSQLLEELHNGPLQIIARLTDYLDHLITQNDAVYLNQGMLTEIMSQLLKIKQQTIQIIKKDHDQANVSSKQILTRVRACIREFDEDEIKTIVQWNPEPEDEAKFYTKYSDVLVAFIREAIRNAIRHGKASQIDIMINLDDTYLRAKAIDNGQGLTQKIPKNFVDLTDRGGHIGLALLQTRIDKLRGDIELCAASNLGAQLSINIPLLGD